MRKMTAAIATIAALLFAPVLWGLPPPGDAVSLETVSLDATFGQNETACPAANLVQHEPTWSEPGAC